MGLSNKELIEKEKQFGCFNYAPIPVVLDEGEGCTVKDADGKTYIDGLAGYGAVNQGHRHPRIISAMTAQMGKLTLTSRAFYNSQLPLFCEFMTKRFNYDRVLPMNTGVEAAESAVKIMRRYGYEKLGIPKDEAIILCPAENFWGRSLAACSASTDPDCRINYGPFIPGFEIVPYNDVGAFKEVYNKFKNRVAGFYVEPVQGEAGIKIPDKGYLAACQEIMKETGALLVCDEIQSGLYRTGKLLASEHFNVKPDMVVLGKALTGGVLPASCVLGPEAVMTVLTPGTHGSTYGGNPLACVVAVEAIKVLDEEDLGKNATKQGEVFRNGCKELQKKLSYIKDVRGLGLFNAIEIDDNHKISAWEISLKMKDMGLLVKPTHGNIIRFTPPLCITDAEMVKVLDVVTKTMTECQ